MKTDFIMLDLDDTLVDFYGLMKHVCYRYSKFILTDNHCTNYSKLRHKFLTYDIIFNFIRRSDILKYIELTKDCFENMWVLKELSKKYFIIISTKRKLWEQKYDVKNIFEITKNTLDSFNIPYDKLHILSNEENKLNILSDFKVVALVDDSPNNLLQNVSKRSDLICINKPWNRYLNHKRIQKTDSLLYLTKYL